MAGWGMDDKPFGELSFPGYDIAVAWDYTDEAFDATLLARYREVVVIAWSMGVYESNRLLPQLKLPVSLAIAVNGTLHPVDDTRGIPVDIFNGTLATLNERNLEKFRRRMCGSRDNLEQFLAHAPRRTLESLHHELAAIGKRALTAAPSGASPSLRWDIAIAARQDLIFPYPNQVNAWSGIPCHSIDASHLPDFKKILEHYVIDKEKVTDSFGRARSSYDSHINVQRQVSDTLAQLLEQHTPAFFDTAIEIGGGTGTFTRRWMSKLQPRSTQVWDIATLDPRDFPAGTTLVCDDAEMRLHRLAPASVDLIASASTLQWFNSPLKAIDYMTQALKPGGTLAFAVYTKGTFLSLDDSLGVSLNYLDAQDYISRLKENNLKVVHHVTNFAEHFTSTRQLLDNLRLTGVNATASPSPSKLRKVLQENSLTHLDYTILYIIATKP